MKVKLLTPTAKAPVRATDGSAGYDLYADNEKRVNVVGGLTTEVELGIAIKIPDGYVGLIQPRSGFAFKKAVDTMAGVIDQDYIDEIKLLLTCHNNHQEMVVERGMRIAQIVVVPCLQEPVEIVDHLESTSRTGGFGSTGTGDVAPVPVDVKAAYDEGYKAGEECNMLGLVSAPVRYTQLEINEWFKGYDAAVSDRLG